MHLLKILGCCLLMGVLLAASGCRTRLDFSTGGTFQSPVQLNEGVIVAFPDDLEGRTYRVKVGRLWETRIFIIPLLDAYRTETVARMGGAFRNGVVFSSHSVLEDLEMHDAPTVKTQEQADRELDAILRELAEEEQATGGIFSSGARRQELADEALREATLESAYQREGNYILHFQDALFGFPSGRAAVSFRVQFVDRRTGNVLLNKRYQGTSRRFSPHRNHRTNEIHLTRLTREAFSGPMRELLRDIAVVLDARE